LRTTTDFDHFVDPDEMVIYPVPAIETGRSSLLNDGLKIDQNSLPAGLVRRMDSNEVMS
jgi:hypothetical protein